METADQLLPDRRAWTREARFQRRSFGVVAMLSGVAGISGAAALLLPTPGLSFLAALAGSVWGLAVLLLSTRKKAAGLVAAQQPVAPPMVAGLLAALAHRTGFSLTVLRVAAGLLFVGTAGIAGLAYGAWAIAVGMLPPGKPH